ncbi:DUF3885 domain-containing protein [Rhodocytophaga rosea]|uniref:DUF3885 domain-containing protein n=1 Tax=Rhodocytophaga rosea TaxID=2704465 RepID=A0A6C0GIS0_9BACT|nr:DUF3885 domain-containing protein [Rhodocytophaga rosea]QHT67825.1 DUF3885 domain-containing protein [Rhodocytophaga rosea]
MPTLKQEYRQFLADNFRGLIIREPLFYNGSYGLRFDLQVGKTNTDQYFTEVVKRASVLFEAIFDSSDNVFFILLDFKWKRRKIRTSNYSFKQIKGVNKSQITFFKVKHLYEPTDRFDLRNMAIIKTTANKISYRNILMAIAHSDFPRRQPRLDNRGILTDKELYFLNIDKQLIFHMYDDRGLDIIASDRNTLQPIYEQFNDWLLDYDRERMDTIFKNNSVQHQR